MMRITLALPSPYVGLRPFDEADALLFFGRDAHVRDLLARMRRQQRFVAVLGASGTGKSSLVRAGLVPALRSGALRTLDGASASGGSIDRWNACVFTPGEAPLTQLARALARDPRWVDSNDPAAAEASLAAALATSPLALANLYRQKAALFANEALLLVVDQFEEIFRFRQVHVDEADSFVKLLLRSAGEALPIYVVTTMRSDFLGQAVGIRGLAEAINDGMYLVPRPSFESVRSAICSPLGLVGGAIDPTLANRLLNMLSSDDELPVLQHAMLRMWNRARAEGRAEIQEADFAAVCGRAAEPGRAPAPGAKSAPDLALAIDHHADAILASLPQGAREIAPRVFLSLAERRGGRDVRRPQTLADVVAQAGARRRDDVVAVIDAFRARGAGFLQPGPTAELSDGITLDISHESLIRQWRRFQTWLRDDETDVSGLREWHLRALRHAQDGAGLLSASDGERVARWRQRVFDGRDPVRWIARHIDTDSSIDAAGVVAYLDDSLATLAAAARRRRAVWRMRVIAVLVMPIVAWLAIPLFGGPAPPRHLVFAVATSQGADADYARQMAAACARVGIAVEIQAAGDDELLAARMASPAAGADLAFVSAGRFEAESTPDLETLGNMYLKPVWIFYRRDLQVRTLADLRGRRVGVGGKAFESSSIARRLLELNGVEPDSLVLRTDDAVTRTTQLLRGEIDVLFMQGDVESPLVQYLLRTPGIALFNDRKAHFHASRVPDLTQVTLPAGIVDGDLPAEDSNLLASTMALVARAGLHPAVVTVLLGEAESVFKGKGLLHEAGTFPNHRASTSSELPLAPAAADYYRSGAPQLQRWFPFWLATLLPQLLPALLVVIVLFIPLLVLAPRLHDAALWVAARSRGRPSAAARAG